jgi:hypothetical protein
MRWPSAPVLGLPRLDREACRLPVERDSRTRKSPSQRVPDGLEQNSILNIQRAPRPYS